VTRLLSRFVLVLTSLTLGTWAYVRWSLDLGAAAGAALLLPFLLVWLVPIVYWVYEREGDTKLDEFVHAAAYLAAGALHFVILSCLVRDLLLAVTWLAARDGALHAFLQERGVPLVLAASLLGFAGGLVAAMRGPGVRRVEIPVERLDPALDGLTIVQLSDLHVGPTIGRRYVERVVGRALALAPDLYALTGDFVDGGVDRLAPHVAPLRALGATGRAYFAMGNHDYYAGPQPWIAHFRSLGLRVLLNEHVLLERRGVPYVLGGVLDPAARLVDPSQRPRPDLATGPPGPLLRVLLAHHPKIAPAAARAGFDLQLSGHTHAGQIFPFTLAVRAVHAPHVAGLSREGRMWVYVSAGTGSWGPPVRFGTRTELTHLTLTRAR
jgi:predicted MPP superfamily phosphohydrolase